MSVPCGCCEPPAGLAPLAVENRPGLSAVVYRIGTYSSFRQALLYALSRADGLPELSTREDDDFAVTLIDLWSAVGDVLTFYQERYANEAYLGTATQRQSVARLAQLIGYELAPGAAAIAQLVFEVDSTVAETLELPAGLRVASVPGPGEQAQVFETLEALVADARLNALRVLPQPVPVNPLSRGVTELLIAPGERGREAAEALAPGTRLLARSASAREELTVADVREEEERLVVTLAAPIVGDTWTAATRIAPLGRTFGIYGRDAPPTRIEVKTDASYPGQVSWKVVPRTDWTYAPVADTNGRYSLPLDAEYEIPRGTRLALVTSAGNRELTVYDTAPSSESLGTTSSGTVAIDAAAGTTVTRVVVQGNLAGLSFDRRTAALHELTGNDVPLWGYAYAPTLALGTAYVPARRIDATDVEVAGAQLDTEKLDLGRPVVLADDATAAVAELVGATVLAGEPSFAGSSAAEIATARDLALAPETAVPGLASGPLALTALPAAPELAVVLGGIGPRTIRLQSVPTTASQAAVELETRLREADPDETFARARVRVAGSRLFVAPGRRGAAVRFEATDADAATVSALGLAADVARSAVRSGVPGALGHGEPALRVRIGGVGPLRLDLVDFPATLSARAAALQALLRAARGGPAFAGASVVAAGGRLLVLSGVVQADEQDYLRLELAPEGESVVLSSGSALLRGNVVAASHGETVAQEALGSGDASTAFQRFTLAKSPLTFVPSAGAGSVDSSLRVFVDGVRWDESATLYGAGPRARAYTITLGESGATIVQFGDGKDGARLPTGSGNVTASYRFGLGEAGRVRAGTLTSPRDRPQGLGSVTNPLPADGGADPESAATARKTAPGTVRTFGRIVSLRDFEDLVRASGEVTKADAIWIWDGLLRGVHMTVAQAGGGELSDTSLRRLAESLDAARDPNRPLRLENAVAVPIVVRATLMVDAAYVRDAVASAARDALLAGFAFENVRIAQTVALSDVFALLQGVAGVVSVDVDELGFKQPAGMPDADFQSWLDERGVVRIGGAVAPVQPRLPILRARPDRERRGRVLPGELPTIASPTQDMTLTAAGGIAA